MKYYNPADTAISRSSLSGPMFELKRRNLLHGKMLDFGTGKGSDVRYLSIEGHDIEGYDRYNKQFRDFDLLKQRYDVVTCHYVFNVIATWEEFTETLETLKSLSDTIYISVRTDYKAVRKSWIYDEELRGYWTNKSFQRFYTPELVRKDFGEAIEIIRKGPGFILFKLR